MFTSKHHHTTNCITGRMKGCCHCTAWFFSIVRGTAINLVCVLESVGKSVLLFKLWLHHKKKDWFDGSEIIGYKADATTSETAESAQQNAYDLTGIKL